MEPTAWDDLYGNAYCYEKICREMLIGTKLICTNHTNNCFSFKSHFISFLIYNNFLEK